ncbi:unnamed protein product [Vicia faba]|uniref:Uncharacterized protein n=1 Tax=Vicia faba TaxID=3906 RepID=A0AAV0Z357_VICFA|nr:unnamed protein product [Vicia faba]
MRGFSLVGEENHARHLLSGSSSPASNLSLRKGFFVLPWSPTRALIEDVSPINPSPFHLICNGMVDLMLPSNSFFPSVVQVRWPKMLWIPPIEEVTHVEEDGRNLDWVGTEPLEIASRFSLDSSDAFNIVELREAGIRFTFSSLQADIFTWLELVPSQLHSNELVFARAFELMCRYLQISATLPLFYAVFHL